MSTISTWPGRAESWLDDRGKFAWIAATVLGFILFWPVGLFILGYMVWTRRLFATDCGEHRGSGHHGSVRKCAHRHGFRSSGNMAFDAYKADMLDRLEREQEAFEAFLKRLRESKDKAEFDQYLDERARAARHESAHRAEAGEPDGSARDRDLY